MESLVSMLPWLLGGLVLAVAMAALQKPLRGLVRLLGRTGVGLAVLWLFGRVGGLIGVTLGVNLFNALVLGVLCFFISLLVRVYLQSNIATALLTGIVGIGLTVCLQWFFLYFFRYSHPSYAFTHHYLPKYLYTLLFLPLVYFLNRGLSQALRPQEESRL